LDLQAVISSVSLVNVAGAARSHSKTRIKAVALENFEMIFTLSRRTTNHSKHEQKKETVMHISALKQSNFLTRAEVGKGVLLTIRQITQENVAKQGAPEELRWCLHFDEVEKPMVLNSTNGQIIAGITKSEDTDTWPGQKIVAYDDPNVSFGGKLVGGIRVRAPKNQPAPKPAAPVAPAAQESDDVPF